MVATRPGSDKLSSGSDRSRAAPAACSIVPMAPSHTSTRPPESSCAAGPVPADDGPLMPGLPLGDQPVPVVVEPEPGDLLDPLDPVGHRVRVDVQQARGALRAVILPEVAGEGRQVLRLVLVFVLRELTQDLCG